MPGQPGVLYFAHSTSDLSVGDGGLVRHDSVLNNGVQTLFVGSSNATARIIAKTGDVVPGTGGGSYLLLSENPSINSEGGVVFQATLIGGTTSRAIVKVPEPGPTLSELAVLAGLAWWARHRSFARTRTTAA